MEDKPAESQSRLSFDRIVVVGASAGGYTALQTLASRLPARFPAPVLIVWHMSETMTGLLPEVLDRAGPLSARAAEDRQRLLPGTIYVAPPNRHMIVDGDMIRLTRGPKENRFRPAIDPLFRSAAFSFGQRAIGVILSGAMDDGTAGLWTIKANGGLAIVQAPDDADTPSMPRSALQNVDVDWCAPLAEIPQVLIQALNTPLRNAANNAVGKEMERARLEVDVADNDLDAARRVALSGRPTPFTCPDCHGVLFEIKDGSLRRLRCHTGHAFTYVTLLESLTESIENSIWTSMRAVQEAQMMLEHMGEHLTTQNDLSSATEYYRAAHAAETQVDLLQRALQEELRFVDRSCSTHGRAVTNGGIDAKPKSSENR